jgi:Lon-like protease
MAGLGVAVLAAIGLASLLPSTLVSEKENQRTGELEPTPYALTPAAADPVNNRIVFGELPDGVERFGTSNDFHFVTVTSPAQSVLSWLAGRNEPAIDFLTAEDKFGVRTPDQRREFNLQLMRTAEQEAQYVALTTLGYDVEITPGEVIVQDVLCKIPGDVGECIEWFPSDEQIDPADRILEADGVPLDSVEDLSALLTDKEPGDTIDLRINRPGVGESEVTVVLSASPDDPDRTIVGFIPFDTRRVELPFELDIDTGRHRRPVGGPRVHAHADRRAVARLDLTGGVDIAVTGTINLDGDRRCRSADCGRRPRRWRQERGVGCSWSRRRRSELRTSPPPASTPRGRGDLRDHPGGQPGRGAGGARVARRGSARADRVSPDS